MCAVLPACLSLLQPSFLPHYVQIASRKLMLFHGRRNLCIKGQQWQLDRAAGSSSISSSDLVIRLSDLVNSPVMAELQELLMLGPGAEQERDLFSNWFSLQVRQCCIVRCCVALWGYAVIVSFGLGSSAGPQFRV